MITCYNFLVTIRWAHDGDGEHNETFIFSTPDNEVDAGTQVKNRYAIHADDIVALRFSVYEPCPVSNLPGIPNGEDEGYPMTFEVMD